MSTAHTFTVYLLIGDDDKPIYVGQSGSVDRRLAQHRRDKTIYNALGGRTKHEATQRAELVGCVDRDDMVATEKMFIENRKPLLNVLDNPNPRAVRRREQIRAAQSGKGLTDFERAKLAELLRPARQGGVA